MKKSSLHILALLFLALLFTQCKKEEPPAVVPVIDKTQIAMGDESGMNIVKYDTLIWGDYNKPASIDLDLDGNGWGDVRLYSNQPGSLGGGIFPIAKIYCLNRDFLLAGILANDTIFLHLDDTTYLGGPVKYNAYFTHYYTCKRFSKKDSAQQLLLGNFHTKDFNSNDIVRQDDAFQSDTATLSQTTTILSTPIQVGTSVSGDTTFWKRTTTLDNCFSFLGGTDRYIAFRMVNMNNRLGWIKLKIVSSCQIQLIETAIEK